MLMLSVFLFAFIHVTNAISGSFTGVPQEAIEAQNIPQKTLVLNGVNFQSRVDITLLSTHSISTFPLKKNWLFDLGDFAPGEYELLVSSYDFLLHQERFSISVSENATKIYEHPLASTNKTEVNQPIEIRVLGFKEYYESPQGKLHEMLMNSPLGFIFKSKAYTAMFVVCMAIMVGPYLVGWLAPDLADRFAEIQREAYEKQAKS